MNKTFLILLFLLPSLLFSKKVINSGHQAPVKFIEYLESEKSYFSLSDDGTLVIKNENDEKITKRIFLSSNSISQLAVSEFNNQIAIVETDSSSQFSISVWDWSKERKLYSINLEEFPMSIGFSGGGNYLYVTSISSTPVKLFKAQFGQSTTYLNKNSNFIDYLYIGSSEKTAFLYSSLGQLDIRSITTSKLLKSIKTESNLTNITITPDKRFLIGQKNNTIYTIGRNDGIVYSKEYIQDLDFYVQNDNTGELLCYVDNRYKKLVKTLQVVSGYIFESNISDIVIKSDVEKLSASKNNLVYADNKGNLFKYSTWDKSTLEFLTNEIINIEDITIIDDIAVLSTSNKILLFQSPFFSDKVKNSKRLTSFTIKEYDSPIKNPIGSMKYNGNIVLWNETLVLLNIETGETILSNKFTSEIIDVKIRDNQLLALDKNGLVKILDLDNGELLFSFKSPGFTSIGFYSETEIIGGVDSSLGGSLMILDTQTKETRPLQTSLDVVFNIFESDKNNIIYIVGLRNVKGTNQTYFLQYNLLTKKEFSFLKNNTEQLHSSFEFNSNNYIYTNMGTKSILRIENKTRKKKPFEITTNQTKHIVYDNGGLYTINENRSLSIWNPYTGKKLIDFYLFEDLEWVAMSKDNITAFGSPNSDKYISSN